jgi:hypothetical protein
MKMIRTTRGLLKIVVVVAFYLAAIILMLHYRTTPLFTSGWFLFLLLAVPPQIFFFTIIVLAVRNLLPFQAAVRTRRSPLQSKSLRPPDLSSKSDQIKD